MRKRIFEIIEIAEDGDRASRAYDLFMIAVIIVSIIPLTMKAPGAVWQAADKVCVTIFIIDYILRLITAALKPWLRSLQESLGYSDLELKNRLKEEMARIRLPFNAFSADECAEICLLELQENIEALEGVYSKKRAILRQQYPDLKI